MGNKNYFNITISSKDKVTTSNIITKEKLIEILEANTEGIKMIKLENKTSNTLEYNGNSKVQYMAFSTGSMINKYNIQNILDELALGYTLSNLLLQ